MMRGGPAVTSIRKTYANSICWVPECTGPITDNRVVSMLSSQCHQIFLISLHGVRSLLEKTSTKQRQIKSWLLPHFKFRSRVDGPSGDLRQGQTAEAKLFWVLLGMDCLALENFFKREDYSEYLRRATALTMIGSWKKKSASQFLHFLQGRQFCLDQISVNTLVESTSWKVGEGLPGSAIYQPSVLLAEPSQIVESLYINKPRIYELMRQPYWGLEVSPIIFVAT